jgi:hypothetical protein
MESIKNHSFKQHRKIQNHLLGISERCNYSETSSTRFHSNSSLKSRSGVSHSQPYAIDLRAPTSSTDPSREIIQIHSRSQKQTRRLQKIQEEVLAPGISNSIKYCRRVPSFHSKEITATTGEKNGKIAGVFFCGNAKCPACAQRVSEKHKNKLKKVIQYSKENNLSVALLTLTFSHQLKDDFESILSKLTEAKTYFMRQRKFRKLDIKWHISRLEFTHSNNNGFHPHFHIAFGVENWDIMNENMLKMEWIRVCNKFGLTCSYDRGLDVIIDHDFNEVENYIMKQSKDISYEIASNDTKSGRFESVSIEYLMDILTGFETDNRYSKESAKSLLEIYYKGIKGKAIFSASNKFQKIYEELELKEEQENTDEKEEETINLDRPYLKIGRWILHFLAVNKQLHYLYDFVGHNDLTRLYDDLLYVLPENLIGGIKWIDPGGDVDLIAA